MSEKARQLFAFSNDRRPSLSPAIQTGIGEANRCQVSHFYYSPITRTAKLMSATRKNHGYGTSSDGTRVPRKNLYAEMVLHR